MAELGELIGVYTWEDKYTAPDTTTVKRTGPKVGEGRIVVLHTLTAVNYTTANKMLIIGRRDVAGSDHYVKCRNQASIYSTWLNGQMILNEGEAPLGIVESPSTSDVLYFSAYGLVYKKPVG